LNFSLCHPVSGLQRTQIYGSGVIIIFPLTLTLFHKGRGNYLILLLIGCRLQHKNAFYETINNLKEGEFTMNK